MVSTKETIYLRGKLFWAKVLGDPVDNYDKNGKEWVFDLSLDENGLKQAKSYPQLNVKNKDDDRGKFLTLKQKATRVDRVTGEVKDNAPISIKDANGKPWDQSQKLGNGTTADVKIEIHDFGKGKFPGIYPKAIRVLDRVEFESQDFAPLSPDDEFFAAASDRDDFHEDFGMEKPKPEDLYDEIPY